MEMNSKFRLHTTSTLTWVIGLLAGAGGNALALNLNPDGYGQVLIFPYYTVNGGKATLLSLQNRTPFGKALKVRFLESQNGREVLDFNLYLAPHDVWTGSIYALDEASPAVLSTADESCTVPAIKHGTTLPEANGRRYLAFTNAAYTNGPGGNHNDAGADELTRTRDGHIEVIEMGIVGNGTGASAQRTLDAISNDGDGTPRNCAQLIDAWNAQSANAYWRNDPLAASDLIAPAAANGGGWLVGSAGIVNGARGTQLTYTADAIEGFSVSILHGAPGAGNRPQLSDANWPTADGATAHWTFNGALHTSRFPASRAVDAVSALFTQAVLHNEFAVIPGANNIQILASEWILTFPTKRFYVDPKKTAAAIAPFSHRFASVTERFAGAGVGFLPTCHDREGMSWVFGEGENVYCKYSFAGQIPEQQEPNVFAETAVLTFRQPTASATTSNIASAPFAINMDLAPENLVGRMSARFYTDFDPHVISTTEDAISRPDLDGQRLVGMPVTGLWIEETRTTSVLANFAGIWKHRGTRCIVPSGAEPRFACPTGAAP
jgi:hypothetical protein